MHVETSHGASIEPEANVDDDTLLEVIKGTVGAWNVGDQFRAGELGDAFHAERLIRLGVVKVAEEAEE